MAILKLELPVTKKETDDKYNQLNIHDDYHEDCSCSNIKETVWERA